ncbi:MAG: DUF2156 domain-containing protein [Treponemataceae bacterium]
MNWHIASMDELEIMQKCALNNNVFANNYGSVNSILYQKKYCSQIAIKDNWIFEKYFENGKICFGFPHNVDGDKSKIKSAIELLVEEAKNSNHTCVFRNITLEEKDVLLELFTSLTIKNLPERSEYIYLTENLSNLSGKKYSKKRNHLHQFYKKYPIYKFELLNSENIELAYQIEEKWLLETIENEAKTENTLDLQREQKIIKNALENFDYFSKLCGMTGGIIFVKNIPIAFCLSSTLSSLVTDIHFEKCLSEFARDGGYAVINNEFSKTVATKYINREEDLGIEGLRKAKLSYYPEIILDKYMVEIQKTQM